MNLARSAFSDDGLAVPWRDELPTLWERMGNVRAYSMTRWSDVKRDITADFAALEAWLVASPTERGDWPKADSLARHAEALGFYEVEDPLFEVAKPIALALRAPVPFAAALRVYAFHARHGRWPESLEEAAPDRRFVDPMTGRALRYQKEPADGATTGFQIVLNGNEPIVVPGKQRRPLEEPSELVRELLQQPPEPPPEGNRPES